MLEDRGLELMPMSHGLSGRSFGAIRVLSVSDGVPGYTADMRGEVARLGARDAIVVIPGIMGSELTDTAIGQTLWGLNDARWYLSAWTTGRPPTALTLTEEEQVGRYGRVRPTRLLRFTAFAPM